MLSKGPFLLSRTDYIPTAATARHTFQSASTECTQLNDTSASVTNDSSVETLAGIKTLAKDPYAGIFSHQYGQELESWQKSSIDLVIPLLADIRPATGDAPTVVD